MPIVTLTWLKPTGSSFNLSFHAPAILPAEREEIEALAIRYGFIINADTWTAPESSEAIAGFNLTAERDGFAIIWKDDEE